MLLKLCQLFREVWSDQYMYISTLSIIVAVYIVLANLNNTMGTKQNATKKTTLIKIINKIYKGQFFCGGGISSRKCTMYLSF